MKELVSILIPAYKAEGFIAETIRSACEQTWTRKEIIVVDDGSPDQTYSIAKKFESAHVKVVCQENGGAPTARNTAFSLAQGEYIQWLDADDLLHADKVSRQLERAENGLTSRTLLTAAWGRFYFRTEKAAFVPDALWQELDPVEWMTNKLRENVWMNPAVWLVSRRLTELAGPWDPRLAKSGDDDGEYVCRVVGNSDRVHFVQDARCYYRIGNAAGLSWSKVQSDDALRALVMSSTLSVQHLLRLEDSERTRHASVRFLEAMSRHLYGASEEHFLDMAKFARQIGCDLKSPGAGAKYWLFDALAGPRVTRKLMTNWRTAKLLLQRSYDELLYRRTKDSA